MPTVRPRLDEVARLAGVSRATASKALNGRSDVSSATRDRVASAASELGYQGVGAGPTVPLIGLVADNMTTTYTLDILRGATTAAMAAGVGLVTQYSEGLPPAGAHPLSDSWFEQVKRSGWLGVIVVTTKLSRRQLKKVAELQLATVAIDPGNALPPGVTSIGATNWNGGVEATEHLIRLGHRRIGFVRGTTGSVPAAERLQGYLSALMMHDLPHDARLVAGDEFSAEAGLRAGLELLSLSPDVRPTGVFAANDAIALGVYQAARQLGLHVPDDLSVVGFDDSLLAPLVTPPLTTVNQPLEDMGAAAVRTLVDLSQSRPVTAGPIRLATSLSVRASTAPPAR